MNTASSPAVSSNHSSVVPSNVIDGRHLSQTGVILTYLTDVIGKFGGRTEEDRLEILGWLLFDNHNFSSFYSTLRLRVGFRMEGKTAVTEFLRAQPEAAFSIVEYHLQTHTLMVAEPPTIADISMAGYKFIDESTDFDLAAYPCTRDWVKRLSALPG